MANPRDIDMELVEAYLARRALDYLVGFTLSPVLWRKLPGARSAGRVQSVALRIVVDREMEIERVQDPGILDRRGRRGRRQPTPFTARLVKHEGKRLTKFDLADEATAYGRPRRRRGRRPSRSRSSRRSRSSASPPPPFTTSTLQQEASRKLGFTAQRTMQAAQKLYEGVDDRRRDGLITYMRTDGVQSAPEAHRRGARGDRRAASARPTSRPSRATTRPRPRTPRRRTRRSARPAWPATPAPLRLDGDLARLYELIWKRMIASQMEQRAHRAHHRRHRERRRPDRPARHRPGGDLRRLSSPSTRKAATTAKGAEDEDDDGGRLPALKEGADGHGARPSAPTSTSPSRRRAIPKPAWSRSWRSSASAGPRPTPRS